MLFVILNIGKSATCFVEILVYFKVFLLILNFWRQSNGRKETQVGMYGPGRLCFFWLWKSRFHFGSVVPRLPTQVLGENEGSRHQELCQNDASLACLPRPRSEASPSPGPWSSPDRSLRSTQSDQQPDNSTGIQHVVCPLQDEVRRYDVLLQRPSWKQFQVIRKSESYIWNLQFWFWNLNLARVANLPIIK